MQFLAPAMLLGLLGVAIPVAIHLIGRRRAPVVRFAALDFLLGSDKKVARRIRLRELLLLLLRVLACAALALVLAKPVLSCAGGATLQVAAGPQAAILIVDDSLTSQHQDGDRSLFEVARQDALDVLSALGPQAEVAVVRTSGTSTEAAALSQDSARHRQLLADMEPTLRPADLGRAIGQAQAALASSSQVRRHVYLFVPGVRAELTGDAPFAGTGDIVFHHVDPARGKTLNNLAVTSAHVEREPDLGPRGIRVIAEIASFSAEPVVERPVTLWVAGRAVARGLVTVGPGERIEKRFSATLPRDERVALASVVLEPDALEADDRHVTWIEPRREVNALLVNGDPRTIRHDDELFYLETALRPGERTDSAVRVTRVPAGDLGTTGLADHDIVFLANVPALAASEADRLAAWVKEGGGLFIALGDQVDADAYERTMGDLVPARLRSARKEPQGLRIGRFEITHPLFSMFTEEARGLRAARFDTVFLVDPEASGDARRTLARYATGAPALIEDRLGRGRVLLFTSSIDRDWNDLPIHPAFLPLVQQIAHYLARVPATGGTATLVAGESRRFEVSSDVARVWVTSPGGQRVALEVSASSEVTFTGTDELGAYRVATAPADGDPIERPELAFAVNAAPRASDVRPWTVAVPAAGDEATEGGAAVGSRRVELWHGIAAGLLLFLFGEALLTRRP